MSTDYSPPAPRTGWQSIPGPIRFVVWAIALTFLVPLLWAAIIALTVVVAAIV